MRAILYAHLILYSIQLDGGFIDSVTQCMVEMSVRAIWTTRLVCSLTAVCVLLPVLTMSSWVPNALRRARLINCSILCWRALTVIPYENLGHPSRKIFQDPHLSHYRLSNPVSITIVFCQDGHNEKDRKLCQFAQESHGLRHLDGKRNQAQEVKCPGARPGT